MCIGTTGYIASPDRNNINQNERHGTGRLAFGCSITSTVCFFSIFSVGADKHRDVAGSGGDEWTSLIVAYRKEVEL